MNETTNPITKETIKYNRIGGTPENPIYFNDPVPNPIPTTPVQPPNITGTSLQQATPVVVPTTTTTSPASSIIADTTGGATSDIEKAKAEYEALQKATGGKADAQSSAMYQAIQDLFTKKGEVTAGQATAEEQAGITKERTALNDINTRIADQNVQIRQELDRIRALPMSDAQRNVELNNIQDTYGRRLADLAILKSAAQGNIEGIQQDAERKTKLLLAPIEDALTYYKEFGLANIDNLNKKEQAQLDFLTKNLEKQKADIKELEDTKAQTIAEVINNGGGTDQNIINAISQAKNKIDAYTAGGKYIGSLDRKLKLAQIEQVYTNTAKARAEAAAKDTSNRVLSEAQLKSIDQSIQGKKLKALSDLKTVQDRYQTLVETYGFEAAGEAKSLLDKAYADFKIAYKEAANLGALTGPDVGLIEEAIKPASGIINYANYVQSGGKEGIVKTLKKSANEAKKEALTNYKNLTLRNPEYSSSDYVKSFIDPFATDIENYTKEQLQKVDKGEIIRTPDGFYLESLGDGKYSQI